MVRQNNERCEVNIIIQTNRLTKIVVLSVGIDVIIPLLFVDDYK
jgi:hypothetical protein